MQCPNKCANSPVTTVNNAIFAQCNFHAPVLNKQLRPVLISPIHSCVYRFIIWEIKIRSVLYSLANKEGKLGENKTWANFSLCTVFHLIKLRLCFCVINRMKTLLQTCICKDMLPVQLIKMVLELLVNVLLFQHAVLTIWFIISVHTI